MIWRDPGWLEEYYQEAVFSLPYESRFRSFQFRYDDQTLCPLGHTIRTPKDLRFWAVKKKPIAIYCMRSQFSQAKNVGKKGTGLADNLFLQGDIVLDLDDRDFGSALACMRMADLSRVYLREHFLDCPSWLVHSGRGWHIWIFDAFILKDPLGDPRQNECNFHIRLSKLLKEMRAAGLSMGEHPSPEQVRTFTNPRQIFRVPGSVNHRNGRIVTLLPSLVTRPDAWSACASSPVFRARGLELAEMRAVMNASPREKKPEGAVA